MQEIIKADLNWFYGEGDAQAIGFKLLRDSAQGKVTSPDDLLKIAEEAEISPDAVIWPDADILPAVISANFTFDVIFTDWPTLLSKTLVLDCNEWDVIVNGRLFL